MIPKLLRAIDRDDLQRLIDERTREDKTIEYKREIPSDKFEILKDVSALANTQGGDIVFGIDEGRGEDRGAPIALQAIARQSKPPMNSLGSSFEEPQPVGYKRRVRFSSALT